MFVRENARDKRRPNREKEREKQKVNKIQEIYSACERERERKA